MLSMLLAYDAAGNVIATLDHVVLRDDLGTPIGLVDFAAHEAAGGAMTEVWVVASGDPGNPATGSKVWPEWLGPGAHDFRVELVGPPGRKRIGALVHKVSGHRRERASLEAAIQSRIDAAGDSPADLRDLVGGPDRPISLDADGKTVARPPMEATKLPLLRKA